MSDDHPAVELELGHHHHDDPAKLVDNVNSTGSLQSGFACTEWIISQNPLSTPS